LGCGRSGTRSVRSSIVKSDRPGTGEREYARTMSGAHREIPTPGMNASHRPQRQRSNRRSWISSGASGGPPGTHHESHIAVEQMEKAYQLPQALGRVGRVEEPVQLRHRGAEATRKLASAESGPLRTPPRLHGQLVNQELRAGLF